MGAKVAEMEEELGPMWKRVGARAGWEHFGGAKGRGVHFLGNGREADEFPVAIVLKFVLTCMLQTRCTTVLWLIGSECPRWDITEC